MLLPTIALDPKVLHIHNTSTTDDLSRTSTYRTSIFSQESARDSMSTTSIRHSQVSVTQNLKIVENTCQKDCHVCIAISMGWRADPSVYNVVGHGNHITYAGTPTMVQQTHNVWHAPPRPVHNTGSTRSANHKRDSLSLPSFSNLLRHFSVPLFDLKDNLKPSIPSPTKRRDFASIVGKMRTSRRRCWSKKITQQRDAMKCKTKQGFRGFVKRTRRFAKAAVVCGASLVSNRGCR